MADEMIEVDPKLFITCRLCLEEMGVYQIVPTVQYQIKYCFDINVEPFDRLPQLLCKKCKVLLDEYCTNKKKFTEKQEGLITKLKVKQIKTTICENKADSVVSSSSRASPHSENVVRSSSRNSSCSANKVSTKTTVKEPEVKQPASVQSADISGYDSEAIIKIPKSKSHKNQKKTKRRLYSNSSSDTEGSKVTKKKTKKHHAKSSKWYRKYNKQFICKICSKSFKERRKMKKHFDAHSYLKSKYDHILNNGCRVKLIKYDGKPNITNLDNTVILDEGKIIQDAGNVPYHVLYSEKYTDNNLESVAKKQKNDYLESSDDDFVVNRKNKRRCRRISRSSNETVVLGDNDKTLENVDKCSPSPQSRNKSHENKETECINIDDSSDNLTDVETPAKSKQATETNIEYKTIENIISNCRIKYLKKLEMSQNGNNNSSKKIYSEPQLKHKILSIGRKNIYKEGHINCTGLLRYMEHKNLYIQWLPKDNRESLVRIMTKLKSATSNFDNAGIEKSGWVTLAEPLHDTPNPSLPIPPIPSNVEISISKSAPPIVLSKSNNVVTNSEPVNTVNPSPLTSTAVNGLLYTDCQNADTDLNSKKILNQSPVANPKQLPKKNNSNETKAKVLPDMASKSFVIDLPEQQSNQTMGIDNFIVPVITSTTSLAQESKIDKPPDVTKALDRIAPRIKVKPVSELMNPPNLKANENTNNIWPINNFENRVTPNLDGGNLYLQILPQIQSVRSIQIAPAERNVLPVNKVTSEVANLPGTDHIFLNSVELPNTRTESPFKYLKDLLLMHDIYLLDPNDFITQEYRCLVKLKVQFKQENKDKLVVLCLSLFCLRNAFCICIRNSNNIDIPMTKISANWQWEIIKIFQGELSNKILNNSQKEGQEVYMKTKTFLFLLKSITCEQ